MICIFKGLLRSYLGAFGGICCWVFVNMSLPIPCAAATAPKQDLLWTLCVHAGDVHYDINEARQAFKDIRHLGASFVRTDFDWDALEPSPGNWDPKAIEFFNSYINEARELGLDVIAILSSPPSWAQQLYKNGKQSEFLEGYSRYAEKVASLYGDRLTYYQYWNESNVFTDLLETKDHWRVFLTADRAVRAANKIAPIGMVNYSVDSFYGNIWTRHLRDTFERINREDPAHTIRTIGIDVYPSTWSLKRSWGGWSTLDELNAILADPGHPCFGFDAAVSETGYSQGAGYPLNTYLGRGERAQAKWYSETIPFLQKKLRDFNNSEHPGKFRWVGIYELYDMSPERTNSINIEGHFGLYHLDRTPKEAVDIIRTLLLPIY